ncbi:MAG: substrate-binding domain-containing protein [Planctomycetes bacterium]|nr:substrate-binding domain-containing protein [Planctomycetota bacterium]
MSHDLIKIGLVFSYSLSYYRDIVRGIRVFSESNPQWVFTPIAPEPGAIESIRPLDLNGLIAHIFTGELADALLRLRKPVVNVSGVLPELKIPRVIADHEQVGRLAAEHFFDRGLRQFGFVGYTNHEFSTGRELGFRREIERAGFTTSSYLSNDRLHPEPTGLWRWDDKLEHWLIGLPRPVGVLCSHDIQGVQLSEVCHRVGLRVPDDIALLGVDDDDLFCTLARPPLSSIALPGERIGFEAARMLHGLLSRSKKRLQPWTVKLPSPGVMTRRSSDILAIEDGEVAKAVRYIRANALTPMGVPDILETVAVSRRSLERRFRAILGRGLAEEICRVRIAKAKELLSETEIPIAQVATNSGFSEAKHLSTAFRRKTGLTPTEFRFSNRTR